MVAEWIRHWNGNPGVVSSSCVGGKMKVVDARRGMNQKGGLYMEE